MTKKSQCSACSLLVGVELNPGPGRGSIWSEGQRWCIVSKWKNEKKGIQTIANELRQSKQGQRPLFINVKKQE